MGNYRGKKFVEVCDYSIAARYAVDPDSPVFDYCIQTLFSVDDGKIVQQISYYKGKQVEILYSSYEGLDNPRIYRLLK